MPTIPRKIANYLPQHQKHMFEYQAKPHSLANKTILVVGAGSGIGKTAALTYAQYGATVILLGKTTEKLEQVYDEIVALKAPEPAIIPLDLKGASKQHYRDMAATIQSQFGKLDGVLFNASILGELTRFVDIHEQTFEEVMKVNVEAQLYMAQALIPVLELAEHGSIIFTSSGVGNKGRAFWGPYCLSKFATEGMMQMLADEYEDSSLRCNAINPGKTRTSMRAKAYPGEDPNTLKTPEQIMAVYLYLMSDDSIGTTGQVLKAQD